jgi:5-methylcytosine-specific restriction endonuclease McrA
VTRTYSDDAPDELLSFLRDRMSMTAVYQPVIIRELLLAGGGRTRDQLVAALVPYDLSVAEYYTRVLMRYPKTVLEKHRVVSYDPKTRYFRLKHYPDQAEVRNQALAICDECISSWLTTSSSYEARRPSSSQRYLVLKAAKGRCELCGIPAGICPIDVDHVVPKSRTNRRNEVRRGSRWVNVDSLENLQALCFRCNRAKRDLDDGDFRARGRLVRDLAAAGSPGDGERPVLRRLTGKRLTSALLETLIEEHVTFIAASGRRNKLEAIVDLVEVAVAIARDFGTTESELLALRKQKIGTDGDYSEGFYCLGHMAGGKP